MTVFFADLVEFTAQAERMNPEEVRALLQSCHGRLRAELERYGGTAARLQSAAPVDGILVDEPTTAPRHVPSLTGKSRPCRPRAFWRSVGATRRLEEVARLRATLGAAGRVPR